MAKKKTKNRYRRKPKKHIGLKIFGFAFAFVFSVTAISGLITGASFLIKTDNHTWQGYTDYLDNLWNASENASRLELTQEQLAEANANYNFYKTQVETLSAEKLTLQNTYNSTLEQLNAKTAKILELEAELEEALQNSDTETIEALQTELEEALTEKETLEEEVSALSSEIEMLNEEIDTLLLEIKDMENYIAELEEWAIADFEFMGEFIGYYNIIEQQEVDFEGVSISMKIYEVEEEDFHYTATLTFNEKEINYDGEVEGEFLGDFIANQAFATVIENVTSDYENFYAVTDVWAGIIDPVNAGETAITADMGVGVVLTNDVMVNLLVDTEIELNYLEEELSTINLIKRLEEDEELLYSSESSEFQNSEFFVEVTLALEGNSLLRIEFAGNHLVGNGMPTEYSDYYGVVDTLWAQAYDSNLWDYFFLLDDESEEIDLWQETRNQVEVMLDNNEQESTIFLPVFEYQIPMIIVLTLE